MLARARLSTIALCAFAALLLACGGSVDDPANHGPYPFTNVPAPANGVAQFSVLPVAIAPGLTLTALGNLNPPGHVLPTDHVYFYGGDLASGHPSGTETRTVYMPATGAVINMIPSTSIDSKVMFRATSTFYFYLDHVVLAKRYGEQTRFYVSPLPLFGNSIIANWL